MIRPISLVVVSMAVNASASAAHSQDKFDETVLRLFRLDERDEALTELTERADYRIDRQEKLPTIHELVVCPQPHSLPILAVFMKVPMLVEGIHVNTPMWVDPVRVPARSGYFLLVRRDGSFVAPYRGANVLHGHLEDLNLDGIVDFADSWGESFDSGSVDSLHVVPVREPLKPSLKVFWKSGRLKWRIKRRNAEVSATIQLGQAHEAPFLLDTREPFFDVKAEYNWSADTETWSGPTGGPHDGFIVVGEDEEAAVTRLLGTATEQKRRVPEN